VPILSCFSSGINIAILFTFERRIFVTREKTYYRPYIEGRKTGISPVNKNLSWKI